MSDEGTGRRERGLVVAVDGPSGSGKSSVSREVARRLGLRYLDTGAMYRAVCWSVLACGLDTGAGEAAQDAVAAHTVALGLEISTDPDDALVAVRHQDRWVEVTDEIREHRISAAVSAVATNLGVRAELRRRQRELIDAARADGRGMVAEGRDITTVVAPDADVRLLLTATEATRLARRAREVHGEASAETVAALRDVVVRRDADDATVSSFHTAADGVLELDSSGLTFEQTVQAVLSVCGNVSVG
ncbi:MAG: (d)CMP kinase [Kineosporiaceae bacterium]|nr:(d)CMP kinase [Kineosporiaceae bacterium]